MIKLKSMYYNVECIGTLKRIPKKVFQVQTVSTNGVVEETYVRSKMNYEINIAKIDEPNYINLIDMFLYDNDFSIIDTDRNIEGSHYRITGDTLTLNEVENKKDKEYYYTGTLTLEKI